MSAKDGPYKPGPPPIAGLSSSLRKDLGPRDTRMDSSPEEREERGGPSTAADKVTNSSPKLMSQDHRSMGGMPSAGPANFGDDQMAIERARRELELLQLQQHQLQSQLAQHEQRQQLMQMQQQQQQQQHHQQFQQQQQQQQLMHHQPIQQPFHSMGDSSMDPRSGSGSGGGSGRQFQQPYPQPEFAFGSDERSFDRFGQRPGAHSFGPPMHAGPADFDQRVQLDQQHRNMHFDQRGSFDQRGPFDARRAADRDFGGSGGGGGGRPDLDLRGGFYSKSGGFDRFQQRSSADAEPLWERAKRLPVDHQSNANSANHSDSNSAGGVYDAQFSPAETNAHAFDSRAAFGAPSEQPLPLQQHRPAATEPPTVILVNSERARDQHQSKPAAASAHVETGRSFASLFPGTQADSAERSQIDRPETSEQQEMIPHVKEAEYDVHKSDFFTHDSYREAPPATEGSEDMPRNDSHEPKKRMLFDPKSSKFVDSSLISDAEKRKRSDSGKFVVKSGPRGREDKVMRADADRSEPRADGKWVKRTLGPQAGEAEGANPNPAIATTTAPPPLPPPRVLQRRAEGGREKPVREDASAQQEAVDLSHATMIVGNNMFPTTGRHLTPQQFQEYLAQRKELREKERARRGPRTKGMLFRYNERSEIERVLNDEERANMIARNEAKQLKLVAGKSDKHAKKRTAHGGEGREADGDDSSDGNGNNEAFGDKLYSARAADHALGRDMHHHQQQAAHSLEHDMGDDRRHSLIHTASGSRVSSPGGAAASGMGLANTQQGPPVYALNQSQMHNSDAFYRDLQLMPHAPSSPFENANFYSGLEVDPADAAIMGVQAYSSNRNVIAPHSVGIFSQQVNAVPAANDDMNIFLVMDSGIGDLDIQKMAAEADANRARQPIKSFIPGVGLAMDNAQMPMHAASVGGNW